MFLKNLPFDASLCRQIALSYQALYIFITPTKCISTLLWWWGLPDSVTGGSLTTGRATHAEKVKR
jgi:hypothetical protein